MNYVVVIIDQFSIPTTRVDVRGPYSTAEEAEQARRRYHLDLALSDPLTRARTYVRAVTS